MYCPNTNPWTFTIIPDERIITYSTSFFLYTEEHRNKHHGCFIRRSKVAAEAKRLSNFCLLAFSSRVPTNFNQPKRLELLKFLTWSPLLTARPDGEEEIVYLWEYVHFHSFTGYRLRILYLHSFLLLYFYLYLFLPSCLLYSFYLAPYFLFPFLFLTIPKI